MLRNCLVPDQTCTPETHNRWRKYPKCGLTLLAAPLGINHHHGCKHHTAEGRHNVGHLQRHTEVDREASGLPERNWVAPMPRQHEEDNFLLPSPSLSLSHLFSFFQCLCLLIPRPTSLSLSLSSLLYSVSSVESMPSGTDILSGQLAVG